MTIQENIRHIRDRIEESCLRSGRETNEIELIAVTKTIAVESIRQLSDAGVRTIGENRAQDAWRKYQSIGSEFAWHMIGHLQTNKVKQVLRFADMIQSVDSIKLAGEIQKQCEKVDRSINILVQVNTSGEPSKFGLLPEHVLKTIETMARFPRLKIKGLMTIAAFLPHSEDVRPCFTTLRNLRDEIRSKKLKNVGMDVLSMGMTHDFEVAIEEGATVVRIGRSIFGERR